MSSNYKSYEWIVFDAVGTLIYATPSVAAAYHSIGHQYGSQLSLEEVRLRFRRSFYSSEADDCDREAGLVTNESIEIKRWKRVVEEVFDDVSNLDACFEELFRHFGQPSAWACFDDVEPTVSALLSADKKIAIASNFDQRLNSVCDGLSPLDLIENRVVSSLIGYRKPSPLFFSTMLEQLMTTADRVLFVGDDPTNDIHGPNAVGIDAIQIDRENSDDDGKLSSLTELIGRLSL